MNKFLLTSLVAASILMCGASTEAMAGTYQNYTPKSYANAQDQSRVLFFYAAWCPYCRTADKALEKGRFPDDVVIFKVDYDKEKSLKAQYGVAAQDTFVLVDSKGKKLTEWRGLKSAQAAHFMAPGSAMMEKKNSMMMKK